MANNIYELKENSIINSNTLLLVVSTIMMVFTIIYIIEYIQCRKNRFFVCVAMFFVLCLALGMFLIVILEKDSNCYTYKAQQTTENVKIVCGEMKDFERENVNGNINYYFSVNNQKFELRCSPVIQLKEFFMPDKVLRENGQRLKVYYVESDDDYYDTGKIILRIDGE